MEVNFFMKDSVFYSSIVLIFIIAGILFYMGSNRGNTTSSTDDGTLVKESDIPTVANEILSSNFNANANIKMQDITLNADVNRTSSNAITLSIQEPKSLEGMNIQYNGDTVNINYKGMSLGLSKNSKALSSVANILMSAIETATAGTGVEIKNVESGISVNGVTDAGDFSILLNPSNNSIASISSQNLDFVCDFNLQT